MVHIIWTTGGFSCEGDSVSITAASQPSIEDMVMGAIPGPPTVHRRNPVLAYQNGDEFIEDAPTENKNETDDEMYSRIRRLMEGGK